VPLGTASLLIGPRFSLFLSLYRDDCTRCSPIQTDRILGQERARDVVEEVAERRPRTLTTRGVDRILKATASPAGLETRDRVNQANIPVNPIHNLNAVLLIHKATKLGETYGDRQNRS
jgi:hypothetical protein